MSCTAIESKGEREERKRGGIAFGILGQWTRGERKKEGRQRKP